MKSYTYDFTIHFDAMPSWKFQKKRVSIFMAMLVNTQIDQNISKIARNYEELLLHQVNVEAEKY